MQEFDTDSWNKVKMINFNYQYALFELNPFMPVEFSIELEEGLTIELKKKRIISESEILCRVENYMDIYFSEELYKKMENWTNKMAAEFDKDTDHHPQEKEYDRRG